MKSFLKFFLLIYLIVPFSCEVDDDDQNNGCQFGIGKERVKDLSIDYAYHLGYSLYEPTIFIRDSIVQQDTLAIGVKVVEVEQFANAPQDKSSVSLISSAFACPPSTVVGRSVINSLTISANDTIKTESKTLLAGESLNELFRVVRYGQSLAIEDLIKRLETGYNSAESSNTFGLQNEVLPFVLNDSINAVKNIQFNFKLVVDGTKTFDLSTKPIEII